MQTDTTSDHPPATAQSSENCWFEQVGKCLHKNCIVGIEHAVPISPNYTTWQSFGKQHCYRDDPTPIYREIERCRATHADHPIRLNIEDMGGYSRAAFIVHRPGPRQADES